MRKQLLITSGRGPQECNLAVGHISKIIQHEANRYQLRTEVVSTEKDNGTYCSIVLSLEGPDAADFATNWMGTIQWICQSPIRKNHKRKNWFIAVLDVEEHSSHPIDEKLIQFETMRSAGAGGQHVNKVSSAVRATYPPLNLAVQVMDTRSQLQNKQLAIQRLKNRIAQMETSKVESLANQKWMNQSQIARGNPIRVFEGLQFKLKCKVL